MKLTSSTNRQLWPPGFRFHPTDEELVLYYLKRKVSGRRLKLDIISETDVYKWDPHDLPGQSKLKTGDRLWFFFSPRDRKYPNAGRSNRATRHGYWKATGKDRHIMCNDRNVGLKKTLVYYVGRAPSGTRTDWVMHEYTLDEEELKRCKNVGDYYALYKVYKKSGPGPKNGEQYGAPFKEEDWVDEEYVENGFNVVEASIVSEPLDTLTADVVGVVSNLNSSIDESVRIRKSNNDIEIPALLQLPSADLYDSFNQTCDDETQRTTFDPSGNNALNNELDSYVYPASQQYDLGGSVDYSVLVESPAVESNDVNASVITNCLSVDEMNKFLNDGDFLEANDLLDPEPIPSAEDNPLANIQFDDENDGLGEWDLFHDASMLLNDTDVNNVNSMFNGGYGMVNNLDYQMQPQLDDASFVTSELWGHVSPHGNRHSGFPSGSINGEKSSVTIHDDQDHNVSENRITSALWEFLESIPTTPASASENISFSKALERVSGFRRAMISVRKPSVAAGNEDRAKASKRRSILLFSIIVALCGMLWVFMTRTVTFL